ncbi:hypothetical protein OOU_Y34scaffold00703g4 [Pyricularia oryzae Y34]|nr:hypothetical protein OOU_Y34scaffold00703g4 [Pyricularia oryzae Y34]
MNKILLPIRATQALFAIIILGLSGYVANWYNMETTASSPSQINFLVFIPIMTVLTLGYVEGVARFMPRIFNPYIALGLEALNALFYFAGFIALAVFLNGLVFCRGPVCGSARASTAFGAFQWILFSVTGGLTAKEVFFKSGFGGGLGGLRRGAGGAPSTHVAGGVRFKHSPMTLPPVSASSGHRSRPSLEVHWKKAALAWDRRASSIDTELGEFIGDDVKEEGLFRYRDDYYDGVSSGGGNGSGDGVGGNDKDNDKHGTEDDHGSIKSEATGGGSGAGGVVGGEEMTLPRKKKRALKRGSVSVVTPFKGSRVLI